MRISDWSSDVCSSDLVDMDDLRVLRDVVVGVEGGVEAEPRAEREDDVSLPGEATGDWIAARAHLSREQRVVGRNDVAVTGRGGDRDLQHLGQADHLLRAAAPLDTGAGHEIGRASGRERGVQYV